MVDVLRAGGEEADAGENGVGLPGELPKHGGRVLSVPWLAVDAPVQVHRRVDAERHPAGTMDGASLADGMVADEPDGIGVGWVVLLVRRRLDLERDLELLEDRPPLRRGGRKDEPHACLTATQISSAGHFRAQSAENAS